MESQQSSVSRTQTHPSSIHMWDAFEHILLFISMYVMVTSIALMFHFFVDKWLPSISSDTSYIKSGYMNNFQLVLLHGYMASLIVSYPVLSFFFLQIAKRTIENPEIKNLKTRKILFYITLVLTFVVMLYSTSSIIDSFLGGNVSINFILHFFITIGLSGFVFLYYLYQVKHTGKINA